MPASGPALNSLLDSLIPAGSPEGSAEAVPEADDVYTAFAQWAESTGRPLYPHQEEALLAVLADQHVIAATPTGSGKSMIALATHTASLARGGRSYYTAPLKALVSEKFFELVRLFGADNVGMVTGDTSINAAAPIICCTAEILANRALREGSGMRIGTVVMDEFHYYANPSRGWAWQVPLLELPQARFLLMSATLGDTARLEADLTERTGREVAVVAHAERPIPLTFEWSEVPLQEKVEELVSTHQAPVYIVHFSQLDAVETAQGLSSISVTSKEEKEAIAARIAGFRFSAGFGHTLNRLVRAGIGVHHAGMLPKYRRLVEKLAQDGLLKVICGTDTLGVGINVPIRTVLLTGLTKYDGTRTRQLRAREFHQIAGRAGRAGFDTTGTVVVQAPEHEIENARLVAKAGDDPKKLRRVQRKKAPEGFVSWSEQTFERLVAADPEPLVSRFAVTNSMLLNVIARPANCFDAMRHLLTDNHEPRPAQRRHILRAITLYRALRESGVVQQLTAPDAHGRWARLTVDLQRDFALDQPLSPFALAAFELLDPADPGYALDVVSILESTLDDPRALLMAQRHRARGEAIAAMKADGIEYDERMELLEEIGWPKPLAELIEPAYETYRRGHPWLSEFTPSPKSVVREMIERAMTFADLISSYELARSEGLVLRYLSDAYRGLRRTVPDSARTEELDDLTAWLGELVRQVDSSLLDEWEQLTDPAGGDAPGAAFGTDGPRPVTANVRAFRVMVRNAVFRLVDLAARRRWRELPELTDGADWADELDPYFAEYGEIGTGPAARGPELFQLETQRDTWTVRQVLDDPDGDRGWSIDATVDLAASDEAGEVVFGSVAVHAG